MATLGSLAVIARLSGTERFLRSSRLNQTRIHQQRQVVLKNHARDLDQPDRNLKRLYRLLPAAITNQLPAYSAGDLRPTTSIERGQGCSPTARRIRALLLTIRVRAAHISASDCRSSRRRYRKNINVNRGHC